MIYNEHYLIIATYMDFPTLKISFFIPNVGELSQKDAMNNFLACRYPFNVENTVYNNRNLCQANAYKVGSFQFNKNKNYNLNGDAYEFDNTGLAIKVG